LSEPGIWTGIESKPVYKKPWLMEGAAGLVWDWRAPAAKPRSLIENTRLPMPGLWLEAGSSMVVK